MRAIDYAIREAWASLWRSRGSSAFAVVAIGLAVTVLGALLLLTSNVERLFTQWASAAEFSVYLRDDATSEHRGAVEVLVDRSGVAAGREYVSKAQALSRFRRDFTELDALTQGLDDNPFPASVEVRVLSEAERDRRADTLVQRVARMPGVADVRYDREWLGRLATGLGAIRSVGITLVLIMALAAGITVTAVVRLGLYAHRDEIEVMRLVGSPMAFIRGPFVAEGMMQGGLGALLAVGLLWLGVATLNAWWGDQLSHVLDGAMLTFLPLRLAAWLVVGGMLVGAAGGFTASRHAA